MHQGQQTFNKCFNEQWHDKAFDQIGNGCVKQTSFHLTAK